MASIIKPYSPSDLKRVINELATTFADRIDLSPAVREQHGKGEDHYGSIPPDAVIYPFSNEEIAQIVRLCNHYHIPVIAYGTGTSVEGHLQALKGGICINLSEMNQVIQINATDMECRVQAGVTREQLNLDLRYDGLFFPVDPGANASLGGMASTRASGTTAVRYGTMSSNVIGLTVITPQGEIITTGGRARKSAAGYDLTHLYVGAEGTLGIITEVQLRLYPVPESISAAVCCFDSTDAAINAVMEAMQTALPMARIEFLNSVQMQACIDYSGLKQFSVKPTLFLEFHGSESEVKAQVAAMQSICNNHNGQGFEWAANTEERNQLWHARHQAYYAAQQLVPDSAVLTTDVCVPVSSLSKAVNYAEVCAEESGLLCPILGHVGDGNFHMLIVHDRRNFEEKNKADSLANQIAEYAISLGGTCTGEHGIGVGKKALLKVEHGPAVDLMQQIKKSLDPNNIMNPGKIFDLE